MSSQDIRLRLAVQRHGLPEVKLVWPCKRTSDVTIAKLLASVNEVVPLESSEWGLEDYAVELVGTDGDSYECLHFQLVAQTLKDEDQLIIRSLLTDDVKRRRISGRHQISIDGKHLVDGVAFGQPWLRAPRGRPAIELPPRKRARIEAHEMEMKEPVSEQQLTLEAAPEHDDETDDEIGDERLFLPPRRNAPHDSSSEPDDDDWKPKQRRNDPYDSSSESENDVNTSEYSGSDEGHLECSRKELYEDIKALREADNEENNSYKNECSVEDIAAIRTAYPSLSVASIEKELMKQRHNLRKTYDALLQSTSTTLSFDDMVDRMVRGMFNQGESSSLQDQPVKIFRQRSPPQRPLIEELWSDQGSSPSKPNSSKSDIMSSDTESPSDSSSEDEDGDDHDDEDDEEGSSFTGENVSSSENSSDDSSDDSSDESSSASSDLSDSGPLKVPDNAQPGQDSAPSKGLSRTQKRNARRRKQKAMNQQTTSMPISRDAELLARKEALLGALQADVANADSQQWSPKPEASGSTPKNDQNAVASTSAETSAQRRIRMDVGAGRRILFGALGLKNPKTKADEERIQKGLLKDVKPLQNSRMVEINEANSNETPEKDADPDAWKSKITYRAVECCHEGMELSEPPFPFVQRWDPQQQYRSMRKRKRKSEDFDADYYGPSPSHGSKATKRDPFKGEVNGTVDEGGNLEKSAGNGINGPANADEAEDLPQVPEDPNTLPGLEKGAAKKGMVITWKQCTMSKATQWQPVITSMAGEVLSDSNESGVEVRLAYRDRAYSEKVYDEKTGQRIYDKFETPDFEDEEDEEDDGLRTVAWEEMTEPKILAATSPWGAKVSTQA